MKRETTSTQEIEAAALGEQCRAARMGSNLSLKRLAHNAGEALGFLHNIEKGEVATVTNLVRVVRTLRVIHAQIHN
jgi:hypothetical protein